MIVMILTTMNKRTDEQVKDKWINGLAKFAARSLPEKPSDIGLLHEPVAAKGRGRQENLQQIYSLAHARDRSSCFRLWTSQVSFAPLYAKVLGASRLQVRVNPYVFQDIHMYHLINSRTSNALSLYISEILKYRNRGSVGEFTAPSPLLLSFHVTPVHDPLPLVSARPAFTPSSPALIWKNQV